MRILDHFYSERPTTPIYHYTDANGMLAIIKTKNLWATHIQFLNDSSEFHHALGMIAASLNEHIDRAYPREVTDMLRILARGLEVITPNTFVISFSEKRDVLSQWRGYCPSGGYNLEFSPHHLSQLAEQNGYRFVKCEYSSQKQIELVDALVVSAIDAIDGFVPRMYHGILDDITQQEKFDLFFAEWFWNKTQILASAIKNNSFDEESEWRLIGGMKGNGIADGYRIKGCLIVPYKDFGLTLNNSTESAVTGATISPMSNPKLAEFSLFRLWHGANKCGFTIKHSSIPYRNLA
jgi:hypothetical protein